MRFRYKQIDESIKMYGETFASQCRLLASNSLSNFRSHFAHHFTR